MWNEDVENIARFAWSKVVRDHVLAPPMPEAQVHRWKFSEPKKKLPDPYYNCSSQESGSISGLVLAGDAFSGEGIEGAYFSGIAAAKSVLDEY
jgi:predicted NAD/FAD-dependent oxidoreductase